jgi:hypothetical protein
MNCAYHADVESVAFCVTCGRALCDTCRRDVSGSIYCETCLADLVRGGGAQRGASAAPSPGGESPGAAFALGLIPGVGAIYNGEFFKAAVHIIIFGTLISVVDAVNALEPLFGLLIMGFYFYMPFEAYYTAKKRKLRGQGVELETPIDQFHQQVAGVENKELWGGVTLVVLGMLFLMDNFRFFRLRAIFEFWPVILIAIGVWLVWSYKEAKDEKETESLKGNDEGQVT